jgi:hypothetical protein
VKTKGKHPQAAESTMETLRELFKPHLKLPKARLTCFLMLVLAVFGQRTVSLVWLARHATTPAKAESVYRRFQRFFASCVLPARTIGALILALSPKPPNGWVLAMDRTNWKFGKSHINILFVTVILNGVGLPIAWRMLPKKTKRGNSNRHHRICLMKDVLAILPIEDIRALTMDREFVGGKWLAWLRLMEVPYVVRVKANSLIGGVSADWWCERNRWKKHASELHEVFGEQVHFAAKRIRKGRDAFVAVISHGYQGAEALELYQMRWGIETFFSHLKKRGYQFEDTHMTKGCRIDKLVGVLAVAFALSYHWGRELERKTGTKLKKHGYRAKSLFRQGFESLHQMLRTPSLFMSQLADFFFHVFRQPLSGNFVV